MTYVIKVVFSGLLLLYSQYISSQATWHSKYISFDQNKNLVYHADDKGNIIPDFSKVGYMEGEAPPFVQTVIELSPQDGDDTDPIQLAIDELATLKPDANGFRGCLLLNQGKYEVSDQLIISTSGIVIRGVGSGEDGTVLIATGKKQYNLIKIEGVGSVEEIEASRKQINMPFVPVGTKKIIVYKENIFQEGDNIMVCRPGTDHWISDIKMDQIEDKSNGKPLFQWEASDYDLHYERKIEKIIGDTLLIDNPIVMEMEDKYGGGYIYKYSFKGRINQCGIENLLLISEFTSETDEDHAWNAVKIDRSRDCWVKNVVAKHFGYSAVNIASSSRNISVLYCKCLEAKSIITGGRRYSFNCNGQLNLFKNCETSEGRHDFVTGARVCGPNVFTQCKATSTHADIGPHHRWATGTLYDQIESDGEINVQDRGNYGSGHGWTGGTQIVWNCESEEICVQNPWVSAINFAIGCKFRKSEGRHSDRPDGVWEGLNHNGLRPRSLYNAQLNSRLRVVTSLIDTNAKDILIFH